MRNENTLVKFTVFVLLITILAMCLVSGTYAKYTSEFAGSDTAVVAKWDVSAGAAETTVDLFGASKIYDTNGADYSAGVDDADVANGTDNGIIAPGTWGSFSYVVTNNSDVNATYSVDYTVNAAGVPLLWSVDGNTWAESLADVSTTALNMGTTANVTVYWQWAFEGATGSAQTDATDTALGEATTLATPTVTLTTTFTQVD